MRARNAHWFGAGASGGRRRVIGDRPVKFSVDETIVVEDTHLNSNDRYYDAAARYFRRLSETVPLHLEIVTVDGSGQSDRITRRAEELGASAIALSPQGFGPVRNIVGFTGRILDESEENQGGKYVNTPQTLIYNKAWLFSAWTRPSRKYANRIWQT
jgi:nucleotide-binding universal stress UspA family protein